MFVKVFTMIHFMYDLVAVSSFLCQRLLCHSLVQMGKGRQSLAAGQRSTKVQECDARGVTSV